ncbi:sulfurtransferase [Microbacterium kribbense]|uniref:Sulfurtransferase n=1 Tax=Microbacterium kribbense TaxID=433645 RepID=A0ABP7GIM5_9MICO
MALLIDPNQLSELLAGPAAVRVLDVRWRLDRPDGLPAYLDGHLPGAVYVDLDYDLAEQRAPQDGRHPLPSLPVLQAAAQRWGLNEGEIVVTYDDWGSMGASRAWWLLRGAGVADVRVLDGGLRSWVDAGLPIEHGAVLPPEGDVVLHEITAGVADIDQAAAWPDHGVLLDVRAADRYRGQTESIDPQAGHIPGAVNLPGTEQLHRGRFRDVDTLRAGFADAGVTAGTPVAAYCGSGITAARTALAGALAGIDVTVYPGSWSQWSNSPGRPVATGDQP